MEDNGICVFLQSGHTKDTLKGEERCIYVGRAWSKNVTQDAYTHATGTYAAIVLNAQDSLSLFTGEKKPLVRSHKHTHTHILVCVFSSSVLFTGQRVNKAAVTFLWEASVTGRLTRINFRTGRGDSCKEEAKRIRNSPGHHLSSGLTKDKSKQQGVL